MSSLEKAASAVPQAHRPASLAVWQLTLLKQLGHPSASSPSGSRLDRLRRPMLVALKRQGARRTAGPFLGFGLFLVTLEEFAPLPQREVQEQAVTGESRRAKMQLIPGAAHDQVGALYEGRGRGRTSTFPTIRLFPCTPPGS